MDSKRKISKSAVLIKYEKINHPPMDEFCYPTDNAYTKKEVVKMEADILKHLKFEVGGPTIMTFLGKFIAVAQKDYQIPNLKLEFLGYYLAELSLLENDCVILLPTLVAASVVFLSRFTIQPKLHPWSSALQDFSSYKPADLKECVLIIHDLQLSKRRGSLVASRNKYKQYEFKCISTLSSPQEIPNLFLKMFKIHSEASQHNLLRKNYHNQSNKIITGELLELHGPPLLHSTAFQVACG
ncbi:hypothetical protein HYC85_012001 [Camellia sinensis]|uniref:Cyclin C-terminal domain-containing protein n=1 Tax=Camellia sinensis TaxID=4442 RepID=A0A7J7HDP5_CAMSI|nr:hypothetical protein HYC85_012001 [Camellia sinensis]